MVCPLPPRGAASSPLAGSCTWLIGGSAMFQNDTVVITGGSSGIGKALALALLRAGARVTIVGNQPARLEDALQEMKAVSTAAMALQCDVSDLTQVRELVARQTDVAPA